MTRPQPRSRNFALQSAVGVAAALLLIAPAASAEKETSFWDGLGAWAVEEKPSVTVNVAATRPSAQGVAAVRPATLHQADAGEFTPRPARDDETEMNADDAPSTAPGDQAPVDDAGPVETDRPPHDADSDVEVVEVDHDADELRDVIRPRYEDEDIADTVLVFTNTVRRAMKVNCRAWNRFGEVLGRLRTTVPEGGVGFLLASDFSEGRDFIGRAHCLTSNRVLATGIFLGPEITELTVHWGPSRGGSRSSHHFPLVATY